MDRKEKIIFISELAAVILSGYVSDPDCPDINLEKLSVKHAIRIVKEATEQIT